MEYMCLGTSPTSQGGDLVHGVILHSDTAKQRFVWQAQLTFQELKCYLVYTSIHTIHVLTAAKLLSTTSSHLAPRLSLKKKLKVKKIIMY